MGLPTPGRLRRIADGLPPHWLICRRRALTTGVYVIDITAKQVGTVGNGPRVILSASFIASFHSGMPTYRPLTSDLITPECALSPRLHDSTVEPWGIGEHELHIENGLGLVIVVLGVRFASP